jgi:hypothetical protein
MSGVYGLLVMLGLFGWAYTEGVLPWISPVFVTS